MQEKSKDHRPTLTLKGPGFTPEFRSLLNKAARKVGKTQAEFAAEMLAEAARRVLIDSDRQSTPSSNPPATVQQLEDMRKAVQMADQKAEATREALQQLTEQVRKLAHASEKQSLWQRLTKKHEHKS